MSVDVNMPILVVDDYQTMVRIMRGLLKQIGFENVDDAANGEAALEKIKQKQYGLIISDWNMEPMTGFQLLQKVREGSASASVPFIMVTAESKNDNIVAARQAGVNHYIVKPFNAATLKSKIDAVFSMVEAA
jgi:two-component system chemotaxis response regulator CheY